LPKTIFAKNKQWYFSKALKCGKEWWDRAEK
jgi:hypothetical protein